MEKYMLPCMFKKLFGIDCLGCGFQRAFVMLCKGEFSNAFHMYPAIYTSVLFLFLLGLHFGDKSRNYSKLVMGTAIINAIIMVISYIYKMSFLFN